MKNQSEYKKLRKEFDNKVKILQEKCSPHHEQGYKRGTQTTPEVLVIDEIVKCPDCNKILEQKLNKVIVNKKVVYEDKTNIISSY